MKPYTISFWWPFGFRGRRWAFTRLMTHGRALWIGRHLWRLRYLGARHFQVEQSVFPTSPIRTEGTPATRKPDVWIIPWMNGMRRNSDGGVQPQDTFIRNSPACQRTPDGRWVEVPPHVLRGQHYPEGSDGKVAFILREAGATNLALWSEGKP